MTPAQPIAWTASTSSIEAIPPDAMIRPRLEDDERAKQVEIRALQQPVASDRGHLERRDPGGHEHLDRLRRRQAHGARPPALAQRDPVPHVDGRDHAFRAMPGDDRARRTPDP